MSISHSVLQTHWHWLPMFWHSRLAYFWDINQRQHCLIHAPSPWASPNDTCIFPRFLRDFLMKLKTQTSVQKKTRLHPPRGENAESWVLSGRQKPKNQETKKPNKPRLHTPRGGGQMQSVGSCLFFVFLVCVWIAIADVPSRDCQALSVVALEARSIHYSTAMFAMT